MGRALLRLGLLLGGLLLSGCGSTVCLVSKRHLHQFDGGARAVYVTNPEMGREFEILRTSGIYPLSTQPEGARRLTLQPIHQYGQCANPLLLSMLTLGIVPGVLPGAYAFEYDLNTDGTTERLAHRLPVYERFSVWEHFVSRDSQKVFAEALAWSELERRPDNASNVGPSRLQSTRPVAAIAELCR